jgi:hypothetical protein
MVDGLLHLQQIPGVCPRRAVQLASRFCEWNRLESASEVELEDVIGSAPPKARVGIGDRADFGPLPDGVGAIG